MTQETKIAIAITVIGLIVVGGYRWTKQSVPSPAVTPSETREQIILPGDDASIYRNVPLVRAYLDELKTRIKHGEAVMPLPASELDTKGRIAQEVLLRDADFLSDTRNGKQVLHNDMMRIVPAPVAALDAKAHEVCKQHACYLAEKYNFVTNTTTRAIVDTDDRRVLSVERFSDAQPDISYRLRRIAEAIALAAPEVKAQLGHTPKRSDITMANVRGSMKESPCENTEHLCVAPTFADTQKGRALWAVVDLTDLRLAAAKWAGLGKTTTPACVSERSLENRYIMENYCQKDSVLDRDGWHIVYRLTASDGLEIRDVTYRGKPVLHSAKIVDWHVSYRQLHGGEQLDTSTPSFMDGRRIEYVRGENGAFMFGYNDAMGCPMFSTSVVLAFNGPQVRDLPGGDGFMLTQDFRNPKWPMACNYRYENRFEFYRDGSFRVVGVNKGRGCGDNAIYRPVMRIDLAVDKQERFLADLNGTWQAIPREIGLRQKGADRAVKSVGVVGTFTRAAVTDASGEKGWNIIPNHGQFGDNSRGDNANLFVTRFSAAEGDRDLLTLGSCCQLDRDGPERFVNGESIDKQRLVVWYVPQIRNDAREGHEYCWADTRIGEDGNRYVRMWPCVVGPKFSPIISDRTKGQP